MPGAQYTNILYIGTCSRLESTWILVVDVHDVRAHVCEILVGLRAGEQPPSLPSSHFL